VTGLIDEIDGEHGMGSLADAKRVARGGVDLDSLEGVPQFPAKGPEPFRG
jgi:hypothetical protein